MITVDSAIGGIWDEIGALMTAAGLEDSSGLRRTIGANLRCRDVDTIKRWLQLSEEKASDLIDRWEKAQPRRKTLDPIEEESLQ